MDIQIVMQQIISGFAIGCIYGLIALGYSLIFNAVDVVNPCPGAHS